MLKGHLCIDLHNVNSGFTERYEQDNLVTNALNILYPLYERSGRLSNFYPIWREALGGIIIFRDPLTESANNVFIPKDNTIVGLAGSRAVTSKGIFGSYNTGESMGTDNSYTSVWDFTTSQANGKISSVARTSKNLGDGKTSYIGGYGDYGDISLDDSGSSSSFAYYPFGYDKTTDTVYFARIQSNVISLYKQRIDLFRRRLRTNLGSSYVPGNTSHLICTLSASDTGTSSPRFHIYDKYLYIATGSPNLYYSYDSSSKTYKPRGSHSLKITRIDITQVMDSPTSVTVETVLDPANYIDFPDVGLPIDTGSSNVEITGSYVFYGDKLYVEIQNKIPNTSNHTDDWAPYNLLSQSISGEFIESAYNLYPVNNMLLYREPAILDDGSSSGRSGLFAKYPQCEEYCLYSSTNVPRTDYVYSKDESPLLIGAHYEDTGLSTYSMTDYLGTICNLDESVTKTESTAMKITYTLTDK